MAIQEDSHSLVMSRGQRRRLWDRKEPLVGIAFHIESRVLRTTAFISAPHPPPTTAMGANPGIIIVAEVANGGYKRRDSVVAATAAAGGQRWEFPGRESRKFLQENKIQLLNCGFRGGGGDGVAPSSPAEN